MIGEFYTDGDRAINVHSVAHVKAESRGVTMAIKFRHLLIAITLIFCFIALPCVVVNHTRE